MAAKTDALFAELAAQAKEGDHAKALATAEKSASLHACISVPSLSEAQFYRRCRPMQMRSRASSSAWFTSVRRATRCAPPSASLTWRASGRFDDVLKFTENKSELQFERAYAYYRLKQLPEALRIVRALPKSARNQTLEAQIVCRRSHPASALPLDPDTIPEAVPPRGVRGIVEALPGSLRQGQRAPSSSHLVRGAR